MKNIILVWLCACSIGVYAGVQKETRKVIYKPEQRALIVNPGRSLDMPVTFEDGPMRRYLRIIGGTVIPKPYAGRGESNFRAWEYHIDDCLDSVRVERDRYALCFRGDMDIYERYAYYRIDGKYLYPGGLSVQVRAGRNGLSVADNRDFGVALELYYKKQGRDQNDVYDRPDSIIYLPVPSGTGPYEVFSESFRLPAGVACALLRVGGRRFSGECLMEAPRLVREGREICRVPFGKFADRSDSFNYWVGVNLTTRNLPHWKVEWNGKTVFEGETFDRSSNVADIYIPLDDALSGTGEMRLTLLPRLSGEAAFDYALQGVEVIEESKRDFEIVTNPRYVSRNSSLGILIETNRPDVELDITGSDEIVPLQKKIRFDRPGLHVVEFDVNAPCVRQKLSFGDVGRTESILIEQVVDKPDDGVYLSVGDDIYVDKIPFYDYYFKWYVKERIGNFYQFRPSYQWSGMRVADNDIVGKYAGLLAKLQMPYAWQVEGRTLAGKRINPPGDVLASPFYQGKQAHENDGGYYYWQHFRYEGLYGDLAARNRPYGGIFAKHRPIYTDHGTFIHYDPYAVKDMADGAARLVANLQYSKGESVRHTGPSTLFRYFYQAGYDWLGAEQMYGPEDIVMSALRGASRAYRKERYGSLHAMQWGSGPYTDPKHALRHFMSMAVAYMHGSSHINTEDALWIDEYANDRYSEAGQQHIAAQHKMLDFIETHNRSGEMVTPVAVIQGRNDAWKSFGRGSLWSSAGDKWKFNAACESFDLLSVFYPQSIVNSCGPSGWFTPTPYGAVDLLPVEAPDDVLNRYEAVVFLGWNSFDTGDVERLTAFVEKGGTLLLTAAHLNAELQPDRQPRFPENDASIRMLLGDRYREWTERTVLTKGDGTIIYYPAAVYPADSSIRNSYIRDMQAIAQKNAEKQYDSGWIVPSGKVDFTVWDSADKRTLYLLNADWQEQQFQTAEFILKDKHFEFPVRSYIIETVHISGELGVMPSNPTTDILSIEPKDGGWMVRVQTTSSDSVTVFNARNGSVRTIVVAGAGIHPVYVVNEQNGGNDD